MRISLSLSLSLSLSRARARSLYARARWARMWGWQEHWTAQQTHQGQVSGMHMRVMSAASASSVARTLRPALVSILKRPHYRERTHSIARESILKRENTCLRLHACVHDHARNSRACDSAARGLDIDSPPKAKGVRRQHLAEDEGAPGSHGSQVHAQDSVGGGGEGGARPASASSQDGKDVKKSIVSPVGQYIKTGQLPVAKVRGSTSCMRRSTTCMGTIRESSDIRESSESLVSSPVFGS